MSPPAKRVAAVTAASPAEPAAATASASGSNATHAAQTSRRDAGDGVDLRFLDLLVDLGGARMTRGALATLDDGETSADARAQEAQTAQRKRDDARQKETSASAPPSTAAAVSAAHPPAALRDLEATPGAGARRELAALSGDVTRQDVRALDQLAISAMAYPGGVPLSQAFPLTPGGKPDFARAGLSDRFAKLMEKAYSENRSVRVELDARSSLILRFFEGKVSAEFLTQDQAMAHYLRQTMDELRQRLSDRQLPVAGLTYRQQENPQQQSRQEASPDGENAENA